jgi:iron complex outermembrane receptor protein
MYKLLLVITLAFFAGQTSAQSKLSVLVLDSASNFPVDGATVKVLNLSDSAKLNEYAANKTGVATVIIQNWPVTLFVTHLGYLSKRVKISLEEKDKSIIVKLGKSSMLLNDVNIVSTRSPISITPEGYQYTLDDNLRNINVNASQILKTLPGIIPGQNGELKVMDKNVAIWIDGKPSNLSGEELNQYLVSLNLNDVKEFKVLANPSAEYSASGGAIIDVILKRQVLDGVLFRVDGGVGTHDKYNLGMNVDFKSKKYTGKYTLNYNHNNIYERSEYNQTNFNSTERYYDFTSRTEDSPVSNVNFSLDNYYALNASNTIGLVLKYNNFRTDITTATSELNISDQNEVSIEKQLSVRTDDAESKVYYANLNYRGKLNKKGTTIEAELFYWRRNALSDYNFIQNIESDVFSRTGIANNTDQDQSLKGLNVKLIHPISKAMSMTIGGQTSFFSIDGNFDNSNFNMLTGNYQFNPGNSFILDYSENLFSGYVNFSGSYKKIRYSAGLRAEKNDITLSTAQLVQNSTNKNNNFGLYPNIGFVYSINKKNLLTLAYNRKIWRVSYSQLNPVNTSSDPTNLSQGNPNLSPSKADTYTLGYNLATKRPIMITFSYMHETNPYMWITLPGAQAATYVTTPRNFNYSDYLTLGLYNKQPITNKMSVSINVSTSLTYLNLENLSLPNPDPYLSAKATLTANYSFWKNASVQLFGNFKTRSISAFGSMGNYQYLDFAFSKKISKKLNANLTVTDFLNVNKFTYRNASNFLTNSGFNKRETRIARISLSYSFGKVKENRIDEYNPFEDTRTQN